MLDKAFCDNNFNSKNSWQKVCYSKKTNAKNSTKTINTKNSILNLNVTTNGNTKETIKNRKPVAVTKTAVTVKVNVSKNNHTANVNPITQQQIKDNCNKLNLTRNSAVNNSQTNGAVGNAAIPQQLSFLRRRRSNQQEVRQIKRAHRHLLTSGGTDWQQQPQGVTTAQKQKICQKKTNKKQQNKQKL